MRRRTIIVEGPLALRMRRIRAAAQNETDVEILTPPQLAARLAGGFLQPAGASNLTPLVRAAIDAGGFADIEPVRTLPGMTRAVLASLERMWAADFDLASRATGHARLGDLHLIETRVREGLRPGLLLAPDLRDRAIARSALAPPTLGDVTLDGVFSVAPLWRPLLAAIGQHVNVSWRAPAGRAGPWFGGVVQEIATGAPTAADHVVCANPHAEVIEALRWMRELIAAGAAAPGEIAIVAASPAGWDDQFLALSADAELPLHFSHGVPALTTEEGQTCAALADLLTSGLSQERVRRFLRHVAGRTPELAGLDASWSRGLEPEAGLFEADQFARALDRAVERRGDGRDPRAALTPALQLLSRGAAAAEEAGARLLPHDARQLWTEALNRAPAKGVARALEAMRVPDGRDAGACAAWCSAAHLAAAPRPFVRFIGMSGRGWPRRAGTDPVLPDRVLSGGGLDEEDVAAFERAAFAWISAGATGACIVSRARRDAQGRALSPSPMLRRGIQWSVLDRERVPAHAFSEADRLVARASEAAAMPGFLSANACWRGWRAVRLTAHDGVVRQDHPQILRALDQVQSATSLRRMLRDPLGFVWRYALGWRAAPETQQELELDPQTYGDLVHDLLRRAVNTLEGGAGFSRAGETAIRSAVAAAAMEIDTEWPLERALPPRLLWLHTLEMASAAARRALSVSVQADTQSWTEVGFGQREAGEGAAPWSSDAAVTLGASGVRLAGQIDRLDRSGRGDARVTDYKTGALPKRSDRIIDGGAELQRVIYATAVRQLMPDAQRLRAQLLFLISDPPQEQALRDPDTAITQLEGFVTKAREAYVAGACHAGPDAFESFNDMRLALPASLVSWRELKRAETARALSRLAGVWRAP
jgi:RecB family exonuclease